MLKSGSQYILPSLLEPFKIINNCASDRCFNFYIRQIGLHRELGNKASVNKFRQEVISFIKNLNFNQSKITKNFELIRELALSFSLNGYINESRFINFELGKQLKKSGTQKQIIQNQLDLAKTYVITMQVTEALQRIEKIVSKINKLKSFNVVEKFIVLMEYAVALRQSNNIKKASQVLDQVKESFKSIQIDTLKGWYHLERSHHLFEAKKIEDAYKHLEIARRFYRKSTPLYLLFVDMRHAFFRIQLGENALGKKDLEKFALYLKNNSLPPLTVYHFLYEKALWAFRAENTKELENIISKINILFKKSPQLKRFKVLIEPLLAALKFKKNSGPQMKQILINTVKEKNRIIQNFYKSDIVDKMIQKDVLPNLNDLI